VSNIVSVIENRLKHGEEKTSRLQNYNTNSIRNLQSFPNKSIDSNIIKIPNESFNTESIINFILLEKIRFLKIFRINNGKKGYKIAFISVEPNRAIIVGLIPDNCS
jgi:hypothetical protein